MSALPRFRSALRRLFRGKEQTFERTMIYRSAENHARRRGATAESVLTAIARGRSRPLTEQQSLELRLALERDLPGEESADGR